MTIRTSTLVATRRIHLDALLQPITIYIWRDDESKWLYATASHSIQTPLQASPDVPQPGPYHQADANEAFRVVVAFFAALYQAAVEEGHTPSSDWLVPV